MGFAFLFFFIPHGSAPFEPKWFDFFSFQFPFDVRNVQGSMVEPPARKMVRFIRTLLVFLLVMQAVTISSKKLSEGFSHLRGNGLFYSRV